MCNAINLLFSYSYNLSRTVHFSTAIIDLIGRERSLLFFSSWSLTIFNFKSISFVKCPPPRSCSNFQWPLLFLHFSSQFRKAQEKEMAVTRPSLNLFSPFRWWRCTLVQWEFLGGATYSIYSYTNI